jgi:hypothetical protein
MGQPGVVQGRVDGLSQAALGSFKPLDGTSISALSWLTVARLMYTQAQWVTPRVLWHPARGQLGVWADIFIPLYKG